MSKSNDELRAMEEKWRRFWEKDGTYRYDPARGRDETFVIDTPPPTVSGSLHIGHVFSYTHTDLMARYRRMRGDNIFYPMGWDDNGLPTERRVQNVFNVRCDPTLPYDEGLSLGMGRKGESLAVSRQNFIELCDVLVKEDEKQFMDLWQRLGLSIDWNETYATIDERCRYVSQLSFLRLVEKGEAELREAPTMWDVDWQSAVAQAEVQDREKEGAFYKLRFDVQGGDHVVIATTRPELVPACIALGCHPDDDRYNHLIGSTAVTPLFRATVPIVAKDDADPTKGTGILMICTFGDTADVDDWRKLGVPAREIIDRSGRILPAPWGEEQWVSQDPETARRYHDKIAGLSINQARKEIVGLLTEEGLIDGDPEKITRPVKYYERGERPLEFVVTRQWFVKVLDKKDRLIEQGRKIQWHPDMFRRRYEDWVEGLNQDWCVSRQRYFGVPIPVWYEVRADGSVDHDALLLPPEEALPIDPSAEVPPGYTEDQRGVAGGFAGDPDVFDTWGTSSLTPLIPTGWPHEERFAKLYPTDLRPQAHEIIRTWAFYTITRSMLEDGSVPWWHAAISGWVLDPERKKMSKSVGNVVLPTDLLDEFGSDAVRYWAGAARLGVDTATDPNVFREGKRLVTKLRNAARLVLGFEGDSGPPERPLDRALVARLATLVEEATRRFDAWDHAGALEAIERWFWDDFCDNYLELSKSRAYDRDPSAIGTLRTTLDVLLRLFAPYIPFVTEDIWDRLHPESGSVHRSSWPRASEVPGGSDDGAFDVLVGVLSVIRRAKSDAKVSIKTPVAKLVVRASSEHLDRLNTVKDDLFAAGNVVEHELIAGDSPEPQVTVELGEPEIKRPH